MINRSLHITFAVCFLILSCGFSINKHFCKDQLQKITVFVQPENCHTGPATSCCTASGEHQGCQTSGKEDCCQNDSDFLKFDAPYIAEKHDDQLIDDFSQAFIEISAIIRINKTEYTSTSYDHYEEPLNKGSSNIFTQSFLL